MAEKQYYARISELGSYDLPVEALRLSEDIQMLRLIRELIEKIDPCSIGPNTQTGYERRRRLQSTLGAWITFAEETMRSYLKGKPCPRERIELKPEKIILERLNVLREGLSDKTTT